MIFGKPKDAKPSLWSPQIPLVPLPWEPWDLILRTGSGIGIELLRQDRYGGYKLKLSMCSLIFN